MVFALIGTVIIMGALFVFAMPQFAALFAVGGQAQLQKSVDELESLIGETYNMAPGSSRIATISLSPNTRICFINPDDPTRRVWETAKKWKWWDPDPVVIQGILQNPDSDQYGSTLWIYTPDLPAGLGYTIDHLKPAPQYSGDSGNFCIRGGVRLYVENKGRFVEVSTAD